jgi:hypothetical protein
MDLIEVALPFDRIVLLSGATERELGVDDFMAFGLQERMKMILERRVSFYQGSQEILPIKALRALYDSHRPVSP